MSLVLRLVNNRDVTAERNGAGQKSCVMSKLQVVSVIRINVCARFQKIHSKLHTKLKIIVTRKCSADFLKLASASTVHFLFPTEST